MVATMPSISEPPLASSSGRVLISIAWLGICAAACFDSARAARATGCVAAQGASGDRGLS